MKSRLLNIRRRKTDDFAQFKTKIFFRTVVMVFLSIFAVWALYSFLLYGKFANWMVALFTDVFGMDYDTALVAYHKVIRSRIDLIFMGAMTFLFFVVFRIYLNWFTKYFMEINRGIDALIMEGAGEVSLSPELSAIQKKINMIKHTLEKRRLETELAEQRKNDLIVYLAHDLKTPLASVIGYLELLHDEGEITGELREKYLSISLEKAERLEELINEFFEIARFNLSNITLYYSTINLTLLLEQLLYEFQPMLREKNLGCRLSAQERIMLKCDADKLSRVFDNLLRNAVLYSFENTEIEITAVGRENEVEVSFVNHGCTIPEDKLERIFEQFYRLDVSRNTKSGGAGLGLAIAKEIVEQHHGTITVKSGEERIIFTVTIPVS